MSSLCTNVPKIMIWCIVPEIWRVTEVIVIFHFWAIFCLFTPQQPKKSKFQKNEKKTRRYRHLTHVYQKL